MKKRETAFLIELVGEALDVPRYWSAERNSLWPWTRNPSEAIRFCRASDAEKAIAGLGFEKHARATEHVWIRPPAKEE